MTVNLFEPYTPKNRRLNHKEMEFEIWLAKMFRRPVCNYLLDKPYYPYLPTTPLANQCKKPETYNVNFDLNFQ